MPGCRPGARITWKKTQQEWTSDATLPPGLVLTSPCVQTVGIDTYCWLHKGIYSCSAELCQGLPTDKFIKYCVER